MCCIGLIVGCTDTTTEKMSKIQFLLKTDILTISCLDFAEELDLKRAAYPYKVKENPQKYNEIVIFLVKTLSEEIVLLSAAADKQIFVTDKEVSTAKEEFLKDYPEDSFEQILLKNAISYSLWEKRFKANLIMEKIIDLELTQKIEITPEDIVNFYNSYNKAKTSNNKIKTNNDVENKVMISNQINNEKELVAQLRMQMTQNKYGKWIQDLYLTYPVEINQEQLKLFLINVKTDNEDDNGNAKEK